MIVPSGHHHAPHVGRGDGVLEQQQGHGDHDHGYPLGHNITLLLISFHMKIKYIFNLMKNIIKNLIKVVSGISF